LKNRFLASLRKSNSLERRQELSGVNSNQTRQQGKHFLLFWLSINAQMQRLFLLVFGLVLATLAAPPPSFDARVAYPQCLGPVVSQGEW